MALRGYQPTEEHKAAVSYAHLGFARPSNAELVAYVAAGATIKEAAHWSGLSPERTRQIVERVLGRRRPVTVRSQEWIDEMNRLLAKGLSFTEVGDALGVTKGTISGKVFRQRQAEEARRLAENIKNTKRSVR